MAEREGSNLPAELVLEHLALNPTARREFTSIKDIPTLRGPASVAMATQLHYAVLRERTKSHDEPQLFFEPGPMIALKGKNSTFSLFDNDERTMAYIERARNSHGEPPARKGISFFDFLKAEYVGRLRKEGAIVAINRTPYTDDTAVFIPPTYDATPLLRKHAPDSEFAQGAKGVLFERSQHTSFFTPEDIAVMGDIAQESAMILWYNGVTPSQQFLHYNGMRDTRQGSTIALTDAMVKGNFTRNRVVMGTDHQDREIRMNCFITDEPEEAQEKLYALEKSDHPADLFAVRGKEYPYFVLFPVSRGSDVSVEFFPDSGLNWHWMPSAEKAGFILKPPFVTVDTAQNTVTVGNRPYSIDEFNSHMFGVINSRHPKGRDIERLAA